MKSFFQGNNKDVPNYYETQLELPIKMEHDVKVMCAKCFKRFFITIEQFNNKDIKCPYCGWELKKEIN